ncbi:MAG: ABC transporter ATP-binding protein [Pseudomonadota bacterium]
MSLEFCQVSHRYGSEPVLRDISFTAPAGQITCLLGPSGCGKTTLMRLAAGILPVQAGAIRLDGQRLADAAMSPPPEARNIGVVFQEGALFGHLTVGKNIAFGLKADQEKDKIINTLLAQVGLSNFAERYPQTLSGGQQQRVAIARALAPEPRVLLLDEPFANIDITRRKALRLQTRAMLKDDKDRVVLLVTHDPEEALEMADEIVVLSGGTVMQAGSPQTLYDAPATVHVATMIGEAQTVSGAIRGDWVETAFGRWPLSCLKPSQAQEGPIEMAVRPRDLTIAAAENGPRIADVRRLRGGMQVTVKAADGYLVVLSDTTFSLSADAQVEVQPKPDSVFAFPPD